MNDRTNADDAEKAVLGSMIRENEATDDVLVIVSESDFRTPSNRCVFAAIVSLINSGRPADVVTVANELHQRGQTQDANYSYLADLLDAAPTAANAIYYAQIVRDAALLRDLAYAGEEIARNARNPAESAEKSLESAEQQVFSLGENRLAGRTVNLPDSLTEACERIEARNSGGLELKGIPTGWSDLDLLTSGLQDSELIVVGARPGVGKTTMALGLARHVALNCGYPVFFATLEQTHSELTERLMCAQAQVDGQQVRRGKILPEEGKSLADSVSSLKKASLIYDDTPRQSMLSIARNARRLKRQQGIRLVIVDYLQLIEPEHRRVPRHEQVSTISRQLKGLARELALPVVALAQVNRASEDRSDRRPRLADLRESGGIEADADTVILLHCAPDAQGRPGKLLECDVCKQRNGPIGVVTLVYKRECYRLENHDRGDPY
jgi:replicative DNA helicase